MNRLGFALTPLFWPLIECGISLLALRFYPLYNQFLLKKSREGVEWGIQQITLPKEWEMLLEVMPIEAFLSWVFLGIVLGIWVRSVVAVLFRLIITFPKRLALGPPSIGKKVTEETDGA